MIIMCMCRKGSVFFFKVIVSMIIISKSQVVIFLQLQPKMKKDVVKDKEIWNLWLKFSIKDNFCDIFSFHNPSEPKLKYYVVHFNHFVLLFFVDGLSSPYK